MIHYKRLGGVAGVAAFLLCVVLPGVARGQEKPKAPAAPATFALYADKGEKVRWRLKEAKGDILGTGGEGYKALADCKKIVERIKSESKGDKLKLEFYEDAAKTHRWRLKASNGDIVAAATSGLK